MFSEDQVHEQTCVNCSTLFFLRNCSYFNYNFIIPSLSLIIFGKHVVTEVSMISVIVCDRESAQVLLKLQTTT